jgi:nitroreductase
MNATELLTSRASNGKLTEPAPDPETLRFAFEAAARAPDHGALRPWRVRIVRGAAREQLGILMANVLRRQNPEASEQDLAKARGKALRAPLILVVGATLKSHPKVPPLEQILAVGAAAHAILLALQARGFGAIWRTGQPAYDDDVKRAFGFAPTDALVGFIYVGTPQQPAPNMIRQTPEEFVSEWTGTD